MSLPRLFADTPDDKEDLDAILLAAEMWLENKDSETAALTIQSILKFNVNKREKINR